MSNSEAFHEGSSPYVPVIFVEMGWLAGPVEVGSDGVALFPITG